MKIGKVPESVLKRSVLRQLKTRRDEIVLGAGLGEDCAILAPGGGEVVLFSSDPVRISPFTGYMRPPMI